MSCYESESGYIHFTKTGYSQFMRSMRDAYNQHIEQTFSTAIAIYDKLKAISGSKVTERRKEEFEKYCTYNGIVNPNSYRGEIICDTQELINITEKEMFRGTGGKLTKPRRSAYPKLTNKISSFSFDCGGEGIVSLSETSHNVSWDVQENNRAVGDARRSSLGSIFLSKLRTYKWKRNEGGCWYYQSEYTRDSIGSSESISEYWGPIGKQVQKDEHDAIMRSVKRSRRRCA